ncbi:hypothetical protein [Nonomuraea sp. NPDC049480]|uniref:hypothetical protein n=1 Tax=Nonomuraea sp. NPDC049480 TaxID=3364353 RepID=UPI003794BBE0
MPRKAFVSVRTAAAASPVFPVDAAAELAGHVVADSALVNASEASGLADPAELPEDAVPLEDAGLAVDPVSPDEHAVASTSMAAILAPRARSRR